MDTFEMTIKKMKEMKPQEMMEQMENLKSMCLCPGCPTYTNCARNAGELVFCANGKSFMCISNEVQCICPNCPVTKQLGYKYKQFCTRGAEKAQRYEHALWGTKMV